MFSTIILHDQSHMAGALAIGLLTVVALIYLIMSLAQSISRFEACRPVAPDHNGEIVTEWETKPGFGFYRVQGPYSLRVYWKGWPDSHDDLYQWSVFDHLSHNLHAGLCNDLEEAKTMADERVIELESDPISSPETIWPV